MLYMLAVGVFVRLLPDNSNLRRKCYQVPSQHSPNASSCMWHVLPSVSFANRSDAAFVRIPILGFLARCHKYKFFLFHNGGFLVPLGEALVDNLLDYL
jgi:hypothetical protein